MKKLLLILVTAVVGLVAHADKTIYYDNVATDWSAVNAHYWGDANGDKSMTLVSGSIYKVELPDGAKNVLFNTEAGKYDNDKATQDYYGLTDGHMYRGEFVNNSKCSISDNGVPSTYTVYFYADNENAMDVYCHIWGSSDITKWGKLPQMTDTGKYVKIGNNYHKAYSYTFLTTVSPTGIIFNSAKGNGTKYVDNGSFSNNKFYTKGQTIGTTQTLVDKGGNVDPIPGDEEYYVYFVNNNNWGQVNIWAWNSNHNHLTNAGAWPGDKMEHVSGNTYKWTLPAGKEVPANVKFSNNGATATDGLVFRNHATYYPNGTIVEEVVRGSNIIYCHFKTDRIRRGDVTAPKCHVFKDGTNVQLHNFGSDEETMVKIDDPAKPGVLGALTDRYEIWKYEIPMDKFQSQGYDCVTFYTNNDNQWTINKSLGANRSQYLKENWTKYIYATAENNGNYACPTYLTPSEFLTLHNNNVAEMGRQEIFITGPKNDFKYFDESSKEWKQFNDYDLLNCDRLNPDDGVFYLKVKPGANSYDDGNTECVGNKFKLSWINVADHRNTAVKREGGSGNADLDNGRKWATFDLGTIGIDKDLAGDNYAENIGPAGRTKFTLNKSLKYTYYNCCDWLIDEQYGSNERWIILDTHYNHKDPNYQCESVTITDFDPHPSMSASIKEFKTDDVLPAGAPSHACLYAKENGHVHGNMLCNSGHAKATIKASTSNTNFNRMYEVEFNGENIANVSGDVASFDYNYFPLDVTNEALKIRARYTDKNTGLKFHSRTGATTVDGLTYTSNAPEDISITGKYIEKECKVEYDSDGKTPKKVERTFGVFVPDFNINIASVYSFGGNTGQLRAYADYRVFDENGNEITDQAKLFTQDHELTAHEKDCLEKNGLSTTPWQAKDNWASTLKEEAAAAPLHIQEINTTPVKDVEELGTRTYTIILHAVYPLVYQKNFQPVASTSSVNGELIPVAKTAAEPVYDTKHVRKTTTVTLTVTPDNTVTGVDEVFGEAEADNAAPAEYYTISGVRVTGDIAPGIYVVRRGNKVTKEVVK